MIFSCNFLLCLSLLTMFSLSAQAPDIEIERAFNRKAQLLLSDFAESIEYVVLETNEHLIDGGLKVYSSGNNLVCIAYRQMYLFDRKTGKFIGEIGKAGKGPGEYISPSYFDSKLQHVIAVGNGRDLYEYDLKGKMIRSILRPKKDIVTKTADGIFTDDWILGKKLFWTKMP